MRILPINNNYSIYNKKSPSCRGNCRVVDEPKKNLFYRTTTYFFRPDMDWEGFASLLKRKYKDVSKVNFINHCCSNGQETYSCVASLINYLGEEDAKKFFPIIAKDFDEINIEAAKKYLPMKLYSGEISHITRHTHNEPKKYFNVEFNTNFDMGHDIYERDLLLLSPKDILKRNVEFSQGDILEDIDNMSSKNTVLLCRNFWPYLDAFKREKLAQKLEDKFDESSIVVIGDYDEEDCKVSKLLIEHKFLPTAVRNVFQKGGEIPNLYNKPIEKSYVVDSSGRIFNLGKSDVNKQADNSIIVAKNSLNFY